MQNERRTILWRAGRFTQICMSSHSTNWIGRTHKNSSYEPVLHVQSLVDAEVVDVPGDQDE